MSNPAVSKTVSNIEQPLVIEEDEINLNELFSKIWRRRKFIGSFVLFALVIVMGFSGFNYLMTAPIKNYSINVRFNFPTSVQGSYPSGQRFSKNDLITTVVLKQVYDNNNIREQGVAFEDFAASFTISPYAANSKFIQQKYDKILSNKKLTRTDIESLEKQYVNELKLAQANFARISYVDTLHLGMPPAVVEKVLNDIPKIWSAISIRDLGVLDLKIPGKQFYQSELVNEYEYLQAVQYMRDSTKRFQTMLTTLQKDDLGGFVRDPETDLVVSDLLARMQNIQRFDLTPLFSVVSSLGLARNQQKAELYLRNQIEVLSDQIGELKQKSAVYKEAMNTYAVAQGRSVLASDKSTSVNAASGSILQLGEGFLSKIVGMVEEKKDTEYRQSLLTRQINVSIQMQELITEQEKLNRALVILMKNHGKRAANKSESELVLDYAAKIKTINQEILQLVSIYQRILEQRNAQVLGKSSALYEQASDQMLVASTLNSKLKKVIIIAIVSTFLALMLAVIVALVVKEKDQATSV